MLERGEVANSWRTERWDSLRLLTPNWQSRLPGLRYEGPDPDGYMVLEPSGRIMFIFGPRHRRAPKTDADRAALFTTLTSYTGRVRLDGPGRFVTQVDYAWNPALSGEQTRFFTRSENRLEIRTPEQTHPSYGDRTFIADLVWQRERP